MVSGVQRPPSPGLPRPFGVFFKTKASLSACMYAYVLVMPHALHAAGSAPLLATSMCIDSHVTACVHHREYGATRSVRFQPPHEMPALLERCSPPENPNASPRGIGCIARTTLRDHVIRRTYCTPATCAFPAGLTLLLEFIEHDVISNACSWAEVVCPLDDIMSPDGAFKKS